MLQIVIFLLCIYLVFKGKELVLLAQLREADQRDRAVRNAQHWFTASMIVALLFALWAVNQGSSMPSAGM